MTQHVERLSYGGAVQALRDNKDVARAKWNGTKFLSPTPHLPHMIRLIVIRQNGIGHIEEIAHIDRLPLLIDDSDRLAKDWIVVNEEDSDEGYHPNKDRDS